MSQTQLNISAVEYFGRHGLTADTHRVALICALLWVGCCRSKLLKMMTPCGLKTSAGDDFADNDIAVAITQLEEGHLIVTDPTDPDVFRLVDSLRVPLYRELLATHPGETLPQLIRQMDTSLLTNLGTSRSWGLKVSRPMTIAYVRASFLAGSSNTALFDLRRLVGCSFDWQAIVAPAIHEGFDGPSFERIEPLWRSQLALQAVRSTCLDWSRDFDLLVDWAFEFLGRQPKQLSVDLRAALGDLALQRGDAILVERAVGGLDGGLAAGVRAAQSVRVARDDCSPAPTAQRVPPAGAAAPA